MRFLRGVFFRERIPHIKSTWGIRWLFCSLPFTRSVLNPFLSTFVKVSPISTLIRFRLKSSRSMKINSSRSETWRFRCVSSEEKNFLPWIAPNWKIRFVGWWFICRNVGNDLWTRVQIELCVWRVPIEHRSSATSVGRSIGRPVSSVGGKHRSDQASNRSIRGAVRLESGSNGIFS